MTRSSNQPPRATQSGATQQRVQAPVALIPLLQLAKQQAHPRGSQALESLLAELYPRITRYLTHRVLHTCAARALAEDVAQETLYLVARHLGHIQATTDGELLRWVWTTARREALHMLGRQAGRMIGQSLANEYEHGLADLAWRRWREEVESELTEDQRRLLVLLFEEHDQLTPDRMELLFVHLVEGRGWDEIAAHLGAPVSAVKRRFQRALEQLKKQVLRSVRMLPPSERQRLLARLEAPPPE